MEGARVDMLEEIDEAFPDHPISAADAFSDWGWTYLDAVEYRAAIDARTRDELDRDYLVRRADALGFLGTRALVAVLPVYLRSMVEDGASKDAAGMLTIILRRPGTGPGPDLGKKRFVALVDALSETQRAAIAHVLHDFAGRYADSSPGERARATLDGYWRSYLPTTAADVDGASDEEGSGGA